MKKILAALLIVLLSVTAVCAGDGAVRDIERAQQWITQERAGTTAREIGIFELRACKTKDIPCTPENQLWSEEISNALGNGGQQGFLNAYLVTNPTFTTLYVGLTDTTSTCSVAKADTLATVVGYGEPSGNGYARIEIPRSGTGWPTVALDSGDYMATSRVSTFTASGGSIGPAYCAFITDAGAGTTGTHVSWAALSTGRTLASGESLQVTYKIKLQ